ncbi:hypothetical protein GCM10027347_24950 [Larkinella harenae]
MKQYYYLEGNQQLGPFSLEELRSKPIKPDTKVWTQGLPDWVSASTVPEINDWLSGPQPAQFSDPYPPNIPQQQPGYPSAQQPYQSQYGHQQPYGNAPLRPKNWLVESILVTLFCCLPFGIAGIINAANVDSRYANGDFAGAQRASNEAGKWTKIGLFVALGFWVLYMLLIFAGVVSGISRSSYY